MAWTTPRTWVQGEYDTSAIFNTEIRDHCNTLWKYVSKGDLLFASSGTVISNLPIVTDGLTLLADSSQTLGVKWAPLVAASIATGAVDDRVVGDRVLVMPYVQTQFPNFWGGKADFTTPANRVTGKTMIAGGCIRWTGSAATFGSVTTGTLPDIPHGSSYYDAVPSILVAPYSDNSSIAIGVETGFSGSTDTLLISWYDLFGQYHSQIDFHYLLFFPETA